MKKKISVFTIVFVVLSALIAILGLFGALKLTGVILDVLFTFLTLSGAGLLTINSWTMLERKNKLALVSLSLISASALLVIIALWSNVSSSGLYMQITLTTCILSVCFNLITSNILKLQNKYLGLQIPSYMFFSIVTIFLISAAWGSTLIGDYVKIFILFIILSLLGMGILAVLSKKQPTEETENNSKYVKITRSEYQKLLEIKASFEKLTGEKND